MAHLHEFSEWNFDVPVNAAAFTTRQVMEEGLPILDVFHDHEGEWQFLCRTTTDAADVRIVCLGCMVDRDPVFMQFADMPSGWVAYRATAEHPWVREPMGIEAET